MKAVTKDTFKLFYRHSLRHRRVMLVVLGCITSAVAVGLTIPYLYKLFFDSLSSDGSREKIGDHLIWITLVILALHGIEWFFWRIATFANNRYQPKVAADLYVSSFVYLHGHSVSFFMNRFVGSIVRRVSRMVRTFEDISDRLFWNFLPLALRIVVTVVVLAILKPMLGVIVMVWIVIYLVASYAFALYKLRFDVKAAVIDSKATGYLTDTITNNANVKLFTAQESELRGYRALNEEQRKLHTFSEDLAAYFEAFQGGFMVILEFVVFYAAIKLWQTGIFSIGDFVLIQTYLVQLFMNLWEVSRIIQRLYRDLADAEEMIDMLNLPHEIQDIPAAKPLLVREGQIVFDAVNFAYHKTREVVSDLSLTIAPGEKVGLVGPSGAGKTTIVGLLFRFFDVTSGHISIDGQDIARVTQNSLRSQAAFVPQDPVLFHRTIMENIRYGRPEATDDEVIAAARKAHCDEFIKEFPDGYNTYVGERGVKLSGGERQRVAIARAILKNAPILVLDEATSSLDSHVEALIQDALAKLMEGKTAIVIAHRLSTINRMDRIVVLKSGRVHEEGTHATLLARDGGVYQHLWQLQAGGFIR